MRNHLEEAGRNFWVLFIKKSKVFSYNKECVVLKSDVAIANVIRIRSILGALNF